MSPELRKEASELRLHKRGIRLNLQLPVTESADEITLRSSAEVWARMQALYLVWQAAIADVAPATEGGAALIASLSQAERAFLLGSRTPELFEEYRAAAETLYFLLWACKLIPQIEIPGKAVAASTLQQLMQPLLDSPDTLGRLQLRHKNDLLDWSDLLYRLHWAVRHAQISQREIPGRLYVPAIQQWHKAVNWLCCYDDQDDWDLVSTETGGAAVE